MTGRTNADITVVKLGVYAEVAGLKRQGRLELPGSASTSRVEEDLS